ncbi:MAG TPA: hypothetical protein VI365_17760 [Trebonia sp.]
MERLDPGEKRGQRGAASARSEDHSSKGWREARLGLVAFADLAGHAVGVPAVTSAS